MKIPMSSANKKTLGKIVIGGFSARQKPAMLFLSFYSTFIK
jgi:hypothetical protein